MPPPPQKKVSLNLSKDLRYWILVTLLHYYNQCSTFNTSIIAFGLSVGKKAAIFSGLLLSLVSAGQVLEPCRSANVNMASGVWIVRLAEPLFIVTGCSEYVQCGYDFLIFQLCQYRSMCWRDAIGWCNMSFPLPAWPTYRPPSINKNRTFWHVFICVWLNELNEV